MTEAGGEDLSYYQKWLQRDGIPILRDFYLENIRTVPLVRWDRKGGLGVYLNLAGAAEADDSYICEIPPGSRLKPQKHLYEELIFVISGRGATTVWNEGGKPQTFEWQEGSLFSPPLNTWHQHFNGRGDQPARYLAVTNAPLVLNLIQNEDFVFGCGFVFHDRYRGDDGYFSGEGQRMGARSWETNFVKDVREFGLIDWKERGGGGKSIFFELCENSMSSHISQFPVGTYKKAHRHGPGAHVVILRGKGYTLMWEAGKPIQRFDWQEGTLIVPPEGWFHQHFNTGKEPARYMAFHRPGSSRKYRMRKQWGIDLSLKEGGDQIEYEDEDPAIRKLFEEELAKEGVASGMDKVLASGS
ncbi:MAG TPA: cupin domain-containing protein [bacterium]|nr:MAG: hypothetical protein A3H27_08645 [Acidobacteria bacterium RIFCSPLOWO2_02_FULL_59_13]HLC26991.1 cupin domain-containing protein [bacterium]